MTVAAQPDSPAPAYAFDNDYPDAAGRLGLLGGILDGFTISRLSSLGDLSGRSCLELGAGNGSIAGWLAGQTGPSGRVLATDINTRHIPTDRGYTVVRHDLATDSIPEGPWDVIHARLVLQALPERHDILGRLAGALAPGGALAIEEWDGYRAGLVLAAPEPEAATLFYAYETGIEQILAAHGLDAAEWPWQLHGAMVGAGLVDVDTAVHARSWPGGTAGAELNVANIGQLHDKLLDVGMTVEQLNRLCGFLRDPRMVVRGLLTISAIGRRPAR